MSEEELLFQAAYPLLRWYRKNRRSLPWRENRDAYRIWISEIMLQQTRVEAAKPYYLRFLEHFPTVAALAAAPDEELLKCWEGLGYYSRARNLKKAAAAVMERHGGVLPDSPGELVSLPGIGEYTAGAIASIAYGKPVPAVDGNVLRVISRVLASREDIAKPAAKKRISALLTAVLERLCEAGESAGDFNQALMETGATVCFPNGAPDCGGCPFKECCISRKEGLTGEIPVKTPPKTRKTEEFTVLLLEYGDKIAIRKRKGDGLLASLYEFPNLPGKYGEDELKTLFGDGCRPERLPAAKHVFSHTEWRMDGYFIALDMRPEKEGGPGGLLPKELSGDIIFVEWDTVRERYPIPSAFAAYKSYLDGHYAVKKC